MQIAVAATANAVGAGAQATSQYAKGTSITTGTASQTAPFGSLVNDAIASVNAMETQARTAVDGMMTGSGVDVHEAMISMQKADMAFELALAVRNKAVQAYQSVMGMQF